MFNLDLSLRYIRWIFLSGLVGFLAGVAASVFLFLLEWATVFRIGHPIIIWGLPLAGFFIGWVYHYFGKEVVSGMNLILDEIHDPKKVIPFYMAPLVLFGTVLTHLFGGSAGREGTVVQLGASLADQLGLFFKIEPEERKVLLVAGAGAGFGAAIGVPFAGIIFGLEVVYMKKFLNSPFLQCVMASFSAFYTTLLLGAPHSHFSRFQMPHLTITLLFWVLIAGLFFGLAARFFIFFTHKIESVYARFIAYLPFKPLIGGTFLVLLFYLEGTYRYTGLGISYIQEAFQGVASFRDPAFKLFFTSLTIGSGFKGGEFVPLVYIGATLGSALSVILPVSFQLLASVGFAAVFGAAANVPITCVVMACELFGLPILPFAVIACFVAYYVSGHRSIYR